MRCPKCGNELAPNAAFCNQCGNNLMQQGRADGPTDALRGGNPGPGGAPAGRPGGAPMGRPGGAPAGRPGGAPGGMPGGAPGGNPSGVLQGGPMPGSGVLQGGPMSGSGVLQGGRVGGGTPIGPSSKKKSMVVPIVISSVVLLALIATIIIILVKRSSGNKDTASKSGDTETVSEVETDDNGGKAEKDNSGDTSESDDVEADSNNPAKSVRVASEDIQLFEVVDGVFFFEGRLFGMSYDEVKDYVYSLGYKYTWDKETEWKYGSEDNLTANRIDLDNKTILGLYFQNHQLVGVTYEKAEVGSISSEIINTANRAYGSVTMLSHDSKYEPYEIFCKYSNSDVNVGDEEEGGSYSVFLNPYNDIDHVDQQYLSNRFDGDYINPNYVIVRTQ